MRENKKGGGAAIAALVLGILGLVAWFVPVIGLPITLVGVALGLWGRQGHRFRVAVVGLVLSGIGFLAALVNAFMGAVLGI